MIYAQDAKKVPLFSSSYTNGAVTTANFDRLNFDYATVDILLGAVSATNLPPTAISLQESDTTAATSFTNIPGGSSQLITTANFTAMYPASSLTTGYQMVTAQVDCRNRKRYIQLTVTPATTQVVAALATLTRAKSAVAADADSGCTVRVIG